MPQNHKKSLSRRCRKVIGTIISDFIFFIRPLFGPSGCCRFTKTCTVYAREQFTTQPLFTAALNTAKRLLSCHPFTKAY